MDANPVSPDPGEEHPESLRQRLLGELATARSGIAEAAGALRHAGDLGARVRERFHQGLPAAMSRHPLPWTAGLALAGFLAARLLVRRPARAVAVAPVEKSGGKLAKQLLLSGAGLLLKPAIKDFLQRKIQEQIGKTHHVRRR